MFKPEDFDIIDMHTHPISTPDTGIGHFEKMTMDEFVKEMNKVGVYKYAGSVISRPASDKMWEDSTGMRCVCAIVMKDIFPEYMFTVILSKNHVLNCTRCMRKVYAWSGNLSLI